MQQHNIQGTITDIAFGGSGVLRDEGLVIFVPFTAVGDVVSVKITKQKSSFAEGVVDRILVPSPDRGTPRCPYFGICGGCQLQHLNDEAQLSYKLRCVEDALKRIGKLNLDFPLTIAAAPTKWNYRRHIQLNLRPSDQGYRVGYVATDNETLLAIQECQIFTAETDPLFTQLQEAAASLTCVDDQVARVTILKVEQDGYLLDFQFPGKLPDNGKKILKEAQLKYEKWKGILASAKGTTFSFGQTQAELSLDSLQFQFSPRAFIQNHPEQSVALYRQMVQVVQEYQVNKLLDLYCGIGISSLLFSQQGIEVIGVENNGEAIACAQQNALINRQTNATFIQANVEKVLKDLLRQYRPDGVLVNPPRQGLHGQVIQDLLQHPPRELMYVSCMPATLARDLQQLCQKYHIQKCMVFDMFPQTAHVETLAILKA